MHPNYDDIVIGAGMAGLTVAALLARSGHLTMKLAATPLTNDLLATSP